MVGQSHIRHRCRVLQHQDRYDVSPVQHSPGIHRQHECSPVPGPLFTSQHYFCNWLQKYPHPTIFNRALLAPTRPHVLHHRRDLHRGKQCCQHEEIHCVFLTATGIAGLPQSLSPRLNSGRTKIVRSDGRRDQVEEGKPRICLRRRWTQSVFWTWVPSRFSSKEQKLKHDFMIELAWLMHWSNSKTMVAFLLSLYHRLHNPFRIFLPFTMPVQLRL